MATLPFDLKTGPDGIATVQALAAAYYRINAVPHSGIFFYKEGVPIPPGDKPVTVLLVMPGSLRDTIAAKD